MELMTPTQVIAIANQLQEQAGDKKFSPHSDEPLLMFARAIERIATQRALEAAAEVINNSEGDMDFALFRIRAMAKELT